MIIDTLRRKNIIVNTDLDGIFSALILHNYLNCEIAGFCNSAEKVWIDSSKISSVYDGVYIDMFVQRADVICIDQHITAIDEEHCRAISALGTKFNPNLDHPRFHIPSTSYYLKYPFGTVHYIIACLERNGVEVNLQFDHLIQPNLFFKDLLLRADDTMQTTVESPYKKNARTWWDWLKDYSHHGMTVTKLCDYLYSLTEADVTKKKTETTYLLKNTYHSDSPDGGFKHICGTNGFLQDKVKNYIQFLSTISGLGVFDLCIKLETHVGTTNRISLTSEQREKIKGMKSNIFSYAFVRSEERAENFSYTIMS